MKIYISGKITDNPDYKNDFQRVEDMIREAGHTPVNPANEKLPDGSTWAEYMRHDIPLLCGCGAIVMLDDWWHSKGATIERELAEEIGIRILRVDEINDLKPIGTN